MSFALVVLALTGTAAAAADTYRLDTDASALYVQVFRDERTIGAGLAHDHVVAATGWTGEVRWDLADPTACEVRITVPVAGLRADEDAARRRVGEEPLSEGQRAKIAESMRGPSQLDAAAFPTITYTATRCEPSGDTVRVTGALTVHGVTRTVTTPMRVTADGTTFTARGTFRAKATDFGFAPYRALAGALRNRDEMTFTVDVKGSTD
ncbi:MAG: YceI family protein [Myxococcota bacterium]